MLTYVGSLSIAALCPLLMSAIGDVSLSISAAFNGAVSANASFSASPPTISTVLTALGELQAQITAAIAAFPPVPNISFTLSETLSLQASLQAAFGLLIVLEGLLTAAIGVLAYGYAGTGDAMGAALTAALSSQWGNGISSGASANALIFGLAASIDQSAFAQFLSGMTFPGSGLVYGGSFGLAALCPQVFASIDQGDAAIQSQLNAALALKASLAVSVPSFVADLEALAKFAAAFAADGALALPNVSFALQATASLSADLNAKYAAVIALGDILANASATAFVYTYSGTGAAFGGEVTTELATMWGDGMTPTNTACTAAILGATDSLTWSTMGSFFGGA